LSVNGWWSKTCWKKAVTKGCELMAGGRKPVGRRLLLKIVSKWLGSRKPVGRRLLLKIVSKWLGSRKPVGKRLLANDFWPMALG